MTHVGVDWLDTEQEVFEADAWLVLGGLLVFLHGGEVVRWINPAAIQSVRALGTDDASLGD